MYGLPGPPRRRIPGSTPGPSPAPALRNRPACRGRAKPGTQGARALPRRDGGPHLRNGGGDCPEGFSIVRRPVAMEGSCMSERGSPRQVKSCPGLRVGGAEITFRRRPFRETGPFGQGCEEGEARQPSGDTRRYRWLYRRFRGAEPMPGSGRSLPGLPRASPSMSGLLTPGKLRFFFGHFPRDSGREPGSPRDHSVLNPPRGGSGNGKSPEGFFPAAGFKASRRKTRGSKTSLRQREQT
jgi:hypothetical protein